MSHVISSWLLTVVYILVNIWSGSKSLIELPLNLKPKMCYLRTTLNFFDPPQMLTTVYSISTLAIDIVMIMLFFSNFNSSNNPGGGVKYMFLIIFFIKEMHQQQRNLTDSKLFNGSKYQKLREKILHYYSNLLVHIFIPKGMHGEIYFKNYILIQGISC